MKRQIIFIIVVLLLAFSCKPKDEIYTPTPYVLTIPTGFPNPKVTTNNPLTFEGINLGRHLFYDKNLSRDNTQSCSSCHNQAFAFSDNGKKFSRGIDGIEGNRNANTIINLAFKDKFFWEGRTQGLENQTVEPVENPVEMHNTWENAVNQLKNANYVDYETLFLKAFGTKGITKERVGKAMAQFLRTIISSNSKYDKFIRQEISLTPSELNGLQIYNTEKGDCFHCHSLDAEQLLTDNKFHNNGLDAVFTDLGLANVTNNANDRGKFMTPTLRNIEKSTPYMHDGRFNTLEEVVNHYNSGGVASPTIDPLMKHVGDGLLLTGQEKKDLINFLKTLSDTDFLNNPNYKSPF